MTRLLRRFAGGVIGHPELALAAVLALTFALLPELAFARAGGGGHGGGGGGGGGSFGGGGGFGGGGFGGGFFFLPFLFGGGGGGGLICLLVLVAMAFFVMRARRSGGGQGYAPDPSYPQPTTLDLPDVNTQLDEIEANDPGFNQQQFLDRAQASFMQLQKAWMDRDLNEGRAYMSTGLYQTWKTQVDQMTAQHKKNVLENLYLQGMHIVRASHDENFDNITVRMDASAMDYEVDDQTGKVVFGDKKDKPFTEYWTFTRSAGTKTLVSGGVTEKKCPNCGAPLSVNETGSCKYCDAAVTSGQFDWVLSRIDQANEW